MQIPKIEKRSAKENHPSSMIPASGHERIPPKRGGKVTESDRNTASMFH
jgi:hypothetical protein